MALIDSRGAGDIDDEPRYAEHECRDCGVILPADRMLHVDERVLADSSSYHRHNASGSSSSGRNVSFKHRESWLCADCLARREAEAASVHRRRRFGWFAAVAAAATLVVIVLAGIMGSHAIPQDVLNNLASASSSEVVADQAVQNANEPVDGENAGIDAQTAASSPPIAPMPPVSPDAPSASAAALGNANRDAEPDSGPGVADDAQRQGMADVGAAVRTATLKALDRRQPGHWHKDGLEGYVTVSEPQVSAGRTCVNVAATMGNGDREDRSQAHLWCRSDEGGEWQPE